eukprot:scaffold470_cov72-Skeletonema_dohrnii-CCMP3373.AAC.3
MAEAHEDDDEMFVYTGGDQVVPRNVRRIRIDKSVTIIPSRAFEFRRRLIDVDFHDGIETIEKRAFYCCYLLRSIKLLGVKDIKYGAFYNCGGLQDVEFGDKLQTIEGCAFQHCYSLRTITMPARNVGEWAFANCKQLTALTFGEELERIGQRTFYNCNALRRITIPLNCMIGDDAFIDCTNLKTVDLVGGIHRTVALLHLEKWRNEMKDEINRINQALPNTLVRAKTPVIQQWVRSVISRLDHYKTQHKAILKEATTLLELALWKAKIEEKEEASLGDVIAKKAKIDIQSKRSERRITSGANIVIKNVLPFLELN